MGNEMRSYQIPNGMDLAVVVRAVEQFLSCTKQMQVQSAPTADGYVVQGRQQDDAWKTIAGMRLATTVQMSRYQDRVNVTIGQGEWSDKIGASALGWFVAWPLAVTAGIGAYQQSQLPKEIFGVIEQYLVFGGTAGNMYGVPPQQVQQPQGAYAPYGASPQPQQPTNAYTPYDGNQQGTYATYGANQQPTNSYAPYGANQQGYTNYTAPVGKSCPSCGAAQDGDAKFCNRCGSKFTVEEEKVCAGCGKPLKPGSLFCSECGEKV